MPAIEKGRVCYKVRGRNAGNKVVISDDKVENGNIKIITPSGEKKSNIRHLFPTERKVTIEKGLEKKLKSL